MNKLLLTVCLCIIYSCTIGQGLNHHYLLGYDTSPFPPYTTSGMARMEIDATGATIFSQVRKMRFGSAQANIADTAGNLLFYTNGQWITNANHDTLLNGQGLNPGSFADAYPLGFPYPCMNIILPWPDSAGKYIILHQTGNSQWGTGMASEVFYTKVDMSLDSGLGGVPVGEKNKIVFSDTLCQGMAACKHANGRDWWITVFKDTSDIVFTMLLTPQGITTVSAQQLNVPEHEYFIGTPVFSPDGNKFAYTLLTPTGNTSYPYLHDLRLFDFNRCTGVFSNPLYINLLDTFSGFGITFSPDSKYLYESSFYEINQFKLDTTDVAASKQTVAMYDGYCFPGTILCTDFWLMYRGADGRIYISSGGSTIDFNCINYPDSAGMSCDVQQHSIPVPCFLYRNHVNHPNYYLGCDTTSGCPCLTSITKQDKHDFKFSISPNPTTGSIKIIYMLPQHKGGAFQLYDINGKAVYAQHLPPWSTLQTFNLSFLTNGVYHCTITSDGSRVSRKLVVIK